jgi:hypothetical protein
MTNDGRLSIPLARYTFDLAFENIIQVGVVAHPSLINVPQDFEVRIAFSFTPSTLPMKSLTPL